ncbi:MAG TPA: AMP-binding protein [Solirubrobacterales bacterium]|jgi:cyclohexanecarboxylate-CoA ligase
MVVTLMPEPALRRRYEADRSWTEELIDGFLAELAADPRSAERPAVVDAGTTLTHAELEQQVQSVAASLAGLGTGRGDVVSWQLPNWLEAVVLHHAILRIGAVSNPIVAIYRRREVEFILRQAESRIFVVPQAFRGFDYPAMVDEMATGLPALDHVVVARGSAPGCMRFEELLAGGRPPEVARSAKDPAVLLYTSGTTADPKGVVHPHATLVRENRTMIDVYGLDQRDSVLMCSPLTHITGLLYGAQLPLMLGSGVVLQDVWDPLVALQLVERHRCAFMVAATPFLHGMTYHEGLAERDVSSLRVFCCGGADVPPQLIRDGEERLGCLVTRVYGSTEYPTATLGSAADPLAKRAETDGRPFGGNELRVVDDEGVELDAGQAGELYVRGPERFSGYLVPQPGEDAFDAEGWFKTGDLASLDADGYVVIRGRKKDIILRGGENISAKEIEDVLFTHPLIAEVAVVAQPDPVMVERACAFIVPAGDRRPTLAELSDFLRGHGLAIQKVPERLEFTEALPKNLAGKVQKFKLRETVRELLEREAAAG